MKRICILISAILLCFSATFAYSQEWPFDEPLPAEEKAVLDEAKTLREQGKYDELKKTLDYFENNPESVYAKKEKVFMSQGTEVPSEVQDGIKLYAEGKYKKSLQVLSKFLKKNPGNLAALSARAVTLATENPGEAIKECDRLMYYLPKYTQLYMAKGVAFRNLGKNEEAVKCFSAYIAFTPDSLIYKHRASTYCDLGRYDEALKDYTESIRLGEKSVEPYLNRGIVYCVLCDYDKAEADFEYYIKAGGKNTYVYKGLSILNINRDNYEKSLEYADNLVKLSPKSAESYYTRGGSYFYLENYKKALEDFDEAIKLNKKFSSAYSGRSITHQKLGNIKNAIADSEKAIKYASDVMDACEAYRAQGLAWLSAKQKENAVSSFEQALQYAYSDSKKQEIQKLIQQAQDL